MTVEIISIGDELLIGQTINTNLTWMGEQLSLIGADVRYNTVVQDKHDDMLGAFKVAMGRVDVVLVTGGLGPTKDDITKQVLCDYFDTKLVKNEEVLKHVRSFFEMRKRPMLDVNIQQAEVPEKSTVLFNKFGTAPGMWLEEAGKVLVSMPGVPYEMKSIMSSSVLDRLKEIFNPEALYYKTIQTQGIGESYIAERIEAIETKMRSEGVALAYLPSPGGVRLRLSVKPTEELKQAISSYIVQIAALLPQYVFGYGDAKLTEVVGADLLSMQSTVSTVESCTGGAVAAALTSVAGSSSYYMGSIVSYSNEIKISQVGVKAQTIEDHGVVSKSVVEEMATNGRKKLGTDYCVALSGIAGPDGGSEENPVGTVWIGVAGPERVIAKKFLFEKDRQRNIRRSVLTALNLLRCELMKINIEKS
jgi:nicotinamide-nucleotide amidase